VEPEELPDIDIEISVLSPLKKLIISTKSNWGNMAFILKMAIIAAFFTSGCYRNRME